MTDEEDSQDLNDEDVGHQISVGEQFAGLLVAMGIGIWVFLANVDVENWAPSEWLAAALVLVNVVLVAITGFYANQARNTAEHTQHLASRTREMAEATQATVGEMRESRQLGIRPKLALDVEMIDPTFGVITVTNIGQGTALDVLASLELSFEDRTSQRRDIQVKTFLSGEKHQYLPTHPKSDQALKMDEFAKLTHAVRLTGVLTDVYGSSYEFNDDLDVRTLWQLLATAERRFTEDPQRKTARELEGIRTWLEEEFRPKRREYGPDEAPF